MLLLPEVVLVRPSRRAWGRHASLGSPSANLEEWNSEFHVIMDGARPWLEEHVDMEADRCVSCLSHLLELRPDVGAGLDAARSHGAGYRDEDALEPI